MRADAVGINPSGRIVCMYTPAHFRADDETAADFLASVRAADLVTVTDEGLVATFLPMLYDPERGTHGALVGHVARNNDQWRRPPTGEAMVIAHGPDSYISPSWYASKAEHGRVVPTWNYAVAHVYGELVVHDEGTQGRTRGAARGFLRAALLQVAGVGATV